MTKHTRALKKAERDFAKATAKLEVLQTEHENVQQALGAESSADDSEAVRKELDRLNKSMSQAKSAQKKAKSKVAEAEMFVMRNRY
ncbi:MAG: hypothetical protein QF660_06485 [Anaerolineales bacterium]|jgi:hypothetical protein|nr:hypothetical protein [Anaerolineales bacterium]